MFNPEFGKNNLMNENYSFNQLLDAYAAGRLDERTKKEASVDDFIGDVIRNIKKDRAQDNYDVEAGYTLPHEDKPLSFNEFIEGVIKNIKKDRAQDNYDVEAGYTLPHENEPRRR